jgi:mercuric ion transport protein
MHAVTASILYFKGCPNHALAIDAMRRVGSRAGFDVKIEELEIKSSQEAERLGFLGSPTVRINDLDVEPSARIRQDFGFSCRTYGEMDVPSDKDIEAALREAIADTPQERTSRSFVSRIAGVLALFTSTGTLLCCALPAALAALAGGASVSSLMSAVPWLLPLSLHKGWIFIGSGIMIALSGVLTFRPRGRVSCSITGGHGCEDAGRFARWMFWLSAVTWSIGVFFSYAIVPILRALEG